MGTDLWKAPGGSACPWRALWPSFIVSLKVRVGQKGEKRARAPGRQLRAHWLCARTKGQRHFYLRSALYCTPTIFKSRLMFAGGEHFCTDLYIAIKVKASPWPNTLTWKQPSISNMPFAQTVTIWVAWHRLFLILAFSLMRRHRLVRLCIAHAQIEIFHCTATTVTLIHKTKSVCHTKVKHYRSLIRLHLYRLAF